MKIVYVYTPSMCYLLSVMAKFKFYKTFAAVLSTDKFLQQNYVKNKTKHVFKIFTANIVLSKKTKHIY